MKARWLYGIQTDGAALENVKASDVLDKRLFHST